MPLNARATLLLLGDLAVLLLFAITGRRTHEEAAGLAAVGSILVTAAPFLAGWLLAAAATGALRVDRTMSVPSMAITTAMTWLLAMPLAMVLRAFVLGRSSPLSFYVVASLAPLAMLLAWRVLFATAESRRAADRSTS